MHLNINDDEFLELVSAAAVRAAIETLARDQFLVLSSGDNHYIQVYHHEDGTFQLEYRDGSADRHYGTHPDETTVEDVVNAFDGYWNQTPNWSDAWAWAKVVFEDEFGDESEEDPTWEGDDHP